MILACKLGLENEVPKRREPLDISQQRAELVTQRCTLLDLASEASALSALALIFKPSSSRGEGFSHSHN